MTVNFRLSLPQKVEIGAVEDMKKGLGHGSGHQALLRGGATPLISAWRGVLALSRLQNSCKSQPIEEFKGQDDASGH